MFENVIKFLKKGIKKEEQKANSKSAAKERLHLVLMQDRANVSADFLELMKQEIIEFIKKYIVVEEQDIDVRLKNKVEEDGSQGAPFLYANIPVLNVNNEAKKDLEVENISAKKQEDVKAEKEQEKLEEADKAEEIVEENEKKEEAIVVKEEKEPKTKEKADKKAKEVKAEEKPTPKNKKEASKK